MSAGVILGTLGITATVVVLGLLIDRRFSLLPRPKADKDKLDPRAVPDPPGTAASAALRLSTRRLTHALGAQRCAQCRGRLDAGPGEPIRYASKQLQVFRMTCSKCGAARGLYVDVVGA